ncbi:MAG: diacylglycerol kinase [Flavobacterium sp.]|nr:diacylglycerol kinase [Flavobacterium sp.]
MHGKNLCKKRRKLGEAKICLIAAVAENRAIGKDNKLLWHIPRDLKRFKEVTSGHPVIMGLKTYESLGKPLPRRTNIVLFPEKGKKIEGCIVCNSIEDAIRTAKEKDSDEIFIIGGGMVYAQTIGLADKLYLTIVEGKYEADTFFPDYSDFKKVVFEQSEEADGYKYKFLELER